MLPALPPFRRRAQRFADALDGRGPADDAQLAGLVQLAEALRRVPAGPAPEFTDQLRRRLVAVASVQVEDATVVAPAPPRGIPALRVRLATGAAAAVTLLTALSVGASTSLPGEALYGLKRAAEGAQLAVAGSDYQRGVRELQFAATRLHEVADLIGHPDVAGLGIAADFRPVAATMPTAGQRSTQPRATGGGHASDIVGALADMQTETAKGARYLARDYQAHNDAKALTTLHAFTTRQYAGLRALLPDLPAAAVPAARASLGQLSGIDRIVYPVLRARQLCAAGCAPAVPVVPGTGSVPPLPVPGDATSGGAQNGSGAVPGQGGAGATGAPGGSSPGLGGLLGGLTGGSGSSTGPTPGAGSSTGSGGLPLPLPTSGLPLPLPTTVPPLPLPTTVPPLPLPTTSLPIPLPGGGTTSTQPSPSASSTPAPGVTVCASPLVLVGGVCVTASLPPIIP